MKLMDKPRWEFVGNDIEITLTVDRESMHEVCDTIDSIGIPKNKDYEIIVRPKRHESSIDTRKKAWILIDELAHKLRKSKKEVHEEMLERYGVMKRDDKGEPIIYMIRNDVPISELKKHYKHFAEIDSKDGYRTFKILKGTTEMDNVEFAAYLDGIIDECMEVGIDPKI